MTQPDNKNLEDKLSSLHESVLTKILSKLPTIDAVRTCVLSKSWRNMWKNITDLQFDDTMQRNENDYRFIEFIDRVLCEIGSLNINSFHLNSVNNLHGTLLILWLSKVLKCNLQRLNISSYKFIPLVDFSSFGSLVELRLHTQTFLKISDLAFLQNLKVFSLKDSSINNNSPIPKDLLLKFPVLQTFIVSDCFFYNTNTLILDSPLLKIFEIFSCTSIKIGESLRVCKIKILASKVEKVTFSEKCGDIFLLDFPPSLPDAHISLCTPVWPEKFLESFTCVKSLSLEVKSLDLELSQVMRQIANDFEVIKVPKFRQLISLNLTYDMAQHSGFKMFLNSTPILEKLTLQDQQAPPSLIESSSRTSRILGSETAPDCIQTTLKVLQIRNFKINKRQIGVLKYVMKNAMSLESVTLYTSQTIEEEDKVKVLSYPKASPHASVFFERSI